MKSIDLILKSNVFERELLSEVVPWISKKQTIAILGARQVGKSHLLYSLIKILHKAKKKNIFYFDLEDATNLEIFNKNIDEIVNYLDQIKSSDDKIYLFLDEIQYLENPSSLIKLLVDHHSNKIKLFISGSSALTIKTKFKDSLIGRKIVFNLNTLSFKEFLLFKKKEHILKSYNKYSKLLVFPEKDLASPLKNELRELYHQYVTYGGYPDVVLEPNSSQKEKLLKEIYSSYVKKDIRSIFDLENINAFNNLVKVLSLQTSSLLNIQNICSEIGIARQTIERYISILQDTFIISLINPLSRNRRKEVVKMPKVYFNDLGLRNVILNDFRIIENRVDKGELIENSIFRYLLGTLKDIELIKYWRNKNQNEINFVIESQNTFLPIEIKSFNVNENMEMPALTSFNNLYNNNREIIINKDHYFISKDKAIIPYYYF